MDLNNLFGENTWDDVRSLITVRVWRKWPRMPREDIEDAVSDAVLDLCEYWVDLPSSVDPTEPVRNFLFAVRRGTWTAHKFMAERFDYYEKHVELNQYSDVCDPITPDDIVVEAEDLDRVRAAIRELSPDERASWFDAFMDGKTGKAVAAEAGTSHQAVNERRRRGVQRLAEAVA